MNQLSVPKTTTSAVLKLNLCDYRSGDSGSTTSTEFVAWIVTALREHCESIDRILFLEADSSGTRVEHLWPLLGFKKLASELGCELFTTAGSEWRRVDSVDGFAIEVPEVVYQADLFINVPKLKFHGRTAYTGALKNNFGILKRKWKASYHPSLCQAIVASNAHLPRQLVLVDGITTLSGRGPAFGVPLRSEVALGSWDPVAADFAGAKLLGIPRTFLSHVEQAKRAGVGGDLADLRWRSESEAHFSKPRFDWPRFIASNALRRG
jgi:uncharacterized protein (DUF362 family)